MLYLTALCVTIGPCFHVTITCRFQYQVLQKNPVVTENNKQLLVETFRSITELLIWGDQNDSRIFEYVGGGGASVNKAVVCMSQRSKFVCKFMTGKGWTDIFVLILCLLTKEAHNPEQNLRHTNSGEALL